MKTELVKRMVFVSVVSVVSGWFLYQGIQTNDQILSSNAVIAKQKADTKHVEREIKQVTTEKHDVKKVGLKEIDTQMKDLALLMYNEPLSNEKALTNYQQKLGKYVTPTVLETISQERTPTVWNNETSFTSYKVDKIGREVVEKNTVQYLIVLAPKNTDELKVILRLKYDVNSGLVSAFKSEREYKPNDSEK